MSALKMRLLFYSGICTFLFCLGCTNEAPDKSSENLPSDAPDILWENCNYFTSQELDSLDTLQQKLRQTNAPEQDKSIFNEYINLLNLSTKSDVQILACNPTTSEERLRLMKHFVFYGLRYGKGVVSFVDNPRMASAFEMEYFYFQRKFYPKELAGTSNYSEADEKVARYLLGGLIAMQASVKMGKNENLDAIVKEIADGFLSLKYGRTSIFNQILFKNKLQLKNIVGNFLLKEKYFIKSFHELKTITTAGTYPQLLREDQPYQHGDFSEVMASKIKAQLGKNVFGLSSGTGGGAPLLTGFFALRNNRVIFLSAGHWKFNGSAAIMQQIDSRPFGAGPSELKWLDQKLNIFNFSEELLVPLFKALDFNNAQIATLKTKLGDNPFAGTFSLRDHLPWIDMAIAIPNSLLLNEAAISKDTLQNLKSLPAGQYVASSIGFGTTEDLESGDLNKNKAPGFRRFTEGAYIKATIPHQKDKHWVLYTPLKLEDLENHPFKEKALATFSLRFGPRCSGAPFFVGGEIVGLLARSAATNGQFIGMMSTSFSPENLAFIDELIADPRGLHSIPEADLVSALRRHMFSTDTKRQEIHARLVKAYSL
jgi:hypothetical protein